MRWLSISKGLGRGNEGGRIYLDGSRTDYTFAQPTLHRRRNNSFSSQSNAGHQKQIASYSRDLDIPGSSSLRNPRTVATLSHILLRTELPAKTATPVYPMGSASSVAPSLHSSKSFMSRFDESIFDKVRMSILTALQAVLAEGDASVFLVNLYSVERSKIYAD